MGAHLPWQTACAIMPLLELYMKLYQQQQHHVISSNKRDGTYFVQDGAVLADWPRPAEA